MAALAALLACACHPLTQAATDGGAAASLACKTALESALPFGRTLTAQATYKDSSGATLGQRTESIDVFFPDGRGRQRTALVTHPSAYPKPDLAVESVTLDETAGGGPVTLTFNDDQASRADVTLTGSFAGPSDGLAATVTRDFGTQDQPKPATATVVFCDSGQDTAAPHLKLASGAPFPLADVAWLSNIPLNVASTDPLAVQASGATLTTTPAATLAGFAVHVVPAWPPGVALQLTGGAPIDVLGRTVTVDALPAPLFPTNVVTDLTLLTAPPDGSVAAAPIQPTYQAGELVLGDATHVRPYAMLVSLGDPALLLPGVAKARVQLQVECPQGAVPKANTSVALITAGGMTAYMIPACSTSLATFSAVLPGPGPLWLAVYYDPGADFDLSVFPETASNRFHLGGVMFL